MLSDKHTQIARYVNTYAVIFSRFGFMKDERKNTEKKTNFLSPGCTNQKRLFL